MPVKIVPPPVSSNKTAGTEWCMGTTKLIEYQMFWLRALLFHIQLCCPRKNLGFLPVCHHKTHSPLCDVFGISAPFE
uniref:Ovule protein n=1 Tax=Caenorhabditis tropicalis TaxID=1561998 RepID=A0A1I7U8K2_9PELO